MNSVSPRDAEHERLDDCDHALSILEIRRRSCRGTACVCQARFALRMAPSRCVTDMRFSQDSLRQPINEARPYLVRPAGSRPHRSRWPCCISTLFARHSPVRRALFSRELGLEPDADRGKALDSAQRVSGDQPGRHAAGCSSTMTALRWPDRWGIAEYLDETRGEALRRPAAFCRRTLTAAGRGAPPARLVPGQVRRRGHGPSRHARRSKAVHAHRKGGGPPDMAAIRAARANVRYHLKYIGYLVATPQLARRRPHDLCGSRGGGPSLGGGLSRRRAMGRGRSGEGLVCAGEVPAVLPARSSRTACRGMAPAAHYADLDF